MHAQIPQSSGNANKMIHPNVLQSNFTLPSSSQTMKQPTTPTTSQLAPQFRSSASTSNYGTMSQFSPATHSSSTSLPTTSSSQSQTMSTPNRPGQAQVIPAQQSTSALQQKKKAEEALRIPEKVEALFPDSQLYTQLLSLEKKIDLCINRRKMELKEALRVTPTKTIRTLRVTISNTHNNHEPFYHTDTIVQHSTSEAPSWTLKIEGRLLDEAQVQPVKGFTQAQPTSTQVKTPKRKFSTYVRKIVVMLDQKAYPENFMIEWMNSNQSEYDGFEIKRKGKVDIPIKVFIYPEYRPAQFKLSPSLAKTLSITADTRLRVMMALWQYIKVNRLQNPEDKRVVTCNAALKEIFGKEKISFLDLPNLITEHLSPPDPIELNYIIKTSGVVLDHHFDIHIQQEDASFLAQTPEATQTAKELEQVENQIIKHLSEINQKKRKRDFMMGFSVNPVDFLNNLMLSQIRDFKVASSDVGKDDEEERHARFYFQPFVYDAVQQYLHTTD